MLPAFVAVLALLAASARAVPSLVAKPDVLPASPGLVTLQWWDVVEDAVLPENSTINFYTGTPGLSQTFGRVDLDGKERTGQADQVLVNTRHPYWFEFTINDEVVARSNLVRFANDDEPLHGHLAVTESPEELLFMFVTKNALAPPLVRLGAAPDALDREFAGESRHLYDIEDMCGSPANDSTVWLDPGHAHRVRLTGLAPSTTYYYQYGSAATGFSAVAQLTTAPRVGEPVRVAVYGDQGVTLPFTSNVGSSYWPSERSTELLARMVAGDVPGAEGDLPISLLVLDGDISYARGQPVIWEWYDSAVQGLTERLPSAVSAGNHEIDFSPYGWQPSWSPYGTDSGGECGVPYSQRYTMPAPPAEFTPPPSGRPNRDNLWYAFSHGVIRFVVLSSEHDFLADSVQWRFVESELKAVNRTETPWVVFLTHRPLYTSSQYLGTSYDCMMKMRENLEPLLNLYDVDLVVAGHVHMYERSCGVSVNGTCASGGDERGTVHVVAGNAGNTYQILWQHEQGDETHFPVPDWLVFRTFDFGISEIQADHETLRFRMRDVTRAEVHDEFVLTK